MTIAPAQPLPSRRLDPRARRSREALHRALGELLSQMPLEEISILAVTRSAELSYPTFFRNYADVDALLVDFAGSLVEELADLVTSEAAAGSMALAIAAFAEERQSIMRPLLTGANTRLQQGILDHALAAAFRREVPANGAIPLELLVPHRIGAVLNVLRWSLADGGQDRHRVAEYIERLAFAV